MYSACVCIICVCVYIYIHTHTYIYIHACMHTAREFDHHRCGFFEEHALLLCSYCDFDVVFFYVYACIETMHVCELMHVHTSRYWCGGTNDMHMHFALPSYVCMHACIHTYLDQVAEIQIGKQFMHDAQY
jgi:hypothetical protein